MSLSTHPKRPRQIDINQVLTRCDNLQQFLQIDNPDYTPSTSTTATIEEKVQKKQNIPTDSNTVKIEAPRQNIITPNLAAIPKPTTSTGGSSSTNGDYSVKKRKMELGYIRIKKQEVLPKPDKYELNDADFDYLQAYNKDLEESKQFTKQQFESIIEQMEMASGKDIIITQKEAEIIFDEKTEKVHSHQEKPAMALPQKIIEDFYRYWVSKRDLLKRPLLATFWRANADDTNPHSAFRPRDKEKMKTRRANRPNDGQALQRGQGLLDEFSMQKILAQQILVREKLKQSICQKKMLKFFSEVQKIQKNNDFKWWNGGKIDNTQDFQHIVGELQKSVNETKNAFNHVTNDYNKLLQSRRNIEEPPVVVEQPHPKPVPVVSRRVESDDTYGNSFQQNNFNIAAIIAATAIESYNAKKITLELLREPEKLNDIVISKIEQEKKENEKVKETRMPPVIQQQHPVNQKTGINFKMWKRIGRNGVVYIDRFFEEPDFIKNRFEEENIYSTSVQGGLLKNPIIFTQNQVIAGGVVNPALILSGTNGISSFDANNSLINTQINGIQRSDSVGSVLKENISGATPVNNPTISNLTSNTAAYESKLTCHNDETIYESEFMSKQLDRFRNYDFSMQEEDTDEEENIQAVKQSISTAYKELLKQKQKK